jgi:hypothetical protein
VCPPELPGTEQLRHVERSPRLSAAEPQPNADIAGNQKELVIVETLVTRPRDSSGADDLKLRTDELSPYLIVDHKE